MKAKKSPPFFRHNENVLDQIKKDMELAAKSKQASRELKDRHGSLRSDQDIEG